MTFNLYEAVRSRIDEEFLKRAAAYSDETESSAKKAFSAILPALFCGLADKASAHDGANTIANLAKEYYAASPAEPDYFGSESGRILNKGAGLLKTMFGETKISNLTHRISSYSGIKQSSAISMLSLAAPVIMREIGENSDKEDTESLFAQFKLEKNGIAEIVPGELKLNTIFDQHLQQAAPLISQSEKAPGSVTKWLILLFVLAAAVMAFFIFYK